MGREIKPGDSSSMAPTSTLPSSTPAVGTQSRVQAAQAQWSEGGHQATSKRVAGRDPQLNAVIKVVAYDVAGNPIRSWSARARWDGPLPQHLHGTAAGTNWRWDDTAAAHTVRLHTKSDGTGGEPVERWAADLHAARIEIYAENADAIATHNDPHDIDNRDDAAPGTGEDEHNARTSTPGGSGSRSSVQHGAGNPPAELPGPVSVIGKGGTDDKSKINGGATVVTGSNAASRTESEDGADANEPDPADEPAAKYERELDTALVGEDDERGEQKGDQPGGGGAGYSGGSRDGRTGLDTATDGHGPGGEKARHDGDGEGSKTRTANFGSKSGSWGGAFEGSADGMAGGEGKEGDRGVPSGMGMFGGKIPVPQSLRGAVEVGILIASGDIEGDITGLGAGFFRRGIRGPAALVRSLVAREARQAARLEMRAVLQALHADNAFLALSESERSAVVRILYWDRQRKFFSGYLSAAREEEAAVTRALRTAKPTERAGLASRASAAKEGERVAQAEPVAGRLPINHAYAGEEFPKSLLPKRFREQGLKIKPSGHPDFTPHAMTLPNGKKEIVIEFSGSYKADFDAANAACGFEKTPKNYTWHHVEDGRTMQLVPSDLHDAVGHTGGVAEYKHAHGVDYRD